MIEIEATMESGDLRVDMPLITWLSPRNSLELISDTQREAYERIASQAGLLHGFEHILIDTWDHKSQCTHDVGLDRYVRTPTKPHMIVTFWCGEKVYFAHVYTFDDVEKVPQGLILISNLPKIRPIWLRDAEEFWRSRSAGDTLSRGLWVFEPDTDEEASVDEQQKVIRYNETELSERLNSLDIQDVIPVVLEDD